MRTFEECVQQGMVQRRKPNVARAESICEGVEKRRKFLEKYVPLNEETIIQSIEERYDIIRELLEAILCKKGFKSYSHEAVIAYFPLCGYTHEQTKFLDTLREIRNGTKYYGKTVPLEYAERVKAFVDAIYPTLYKKAIGI